MKTSIWITAALVTLFVGCANFFPTRGPIVLDREAIDAEIAAITQGTGIEVSAWIAGAEGEPWYTLNADEWHAGASAVKTAYLVELCAVNAGHLDEPLPETEGILADPMHPAIVHFSPEVQEEIRTELIGASVRRIGEVMIHGDGVSNPVYNAAANITTAALGGPEGITQRMRERMPEAEGIEIRRYMLADRNVTGDNETTAAALGQVLQRIASGNLPGLDARTIWCIRGALRLDRWLWLGDHFHKSGGLNSSPLVRIRSGYFTKRNRVVTYVVIAQQAEPGNMTAAEAGENLQRVCDDIRDVLLRRARVQVHGRYSFLPW